MIRGRFKVKTQLMIVFSGLLFMLIASFLLLNINFLKSYYLRDKEKQFQEMYEALNQATVDGDLADEDTYMELVHLAEKYNLYFLVSDASSGIFYTNVHDKDSLSNQMLRYYIEQDFLQGQDELSLDDSTEGEDDQSQGETNTGKTEESQSKKGPEDKEGNSKKIISSEDNYSLIQTKDPVNNTDYLEMYGKCQDESAFIVRSPLESIEESVAISNQFFIAIGCTLMVIILFFFVFLKLQYFLDVLLKHLFLYLYYLNLFAVGDFLFFLLEVYLGQHFQQLILLSFLLLLLFLQRFFWLLLLLLLLLLVR